MNKENKEIVKEVNIIVEGNSNDNRWDGNMKFTHEDLS